MSIPIANDRVPRAAAPAIPAVNAPSQDAVNMFHSQNQINSQSNTVTEPNSEETAGQSGSNASEKTDKLKNTLANFSNLTDKQRRSAVLSLATELTESNGHLSEQSQLILAPFSAYKELTPEAQKAAISTAVAALNRDSETSPEASDSLSFSGRITGLAQLAASSLASEDVSKFMDLIEKPLDKDEVTALVQEALAHMSDREISNMAGPEMGDLSRDEIMAHVGSAAAHIIRGAITDLAMKALDNLSADDVKQFQGGKEAIQELSTEQLDGLATNALSTLSDKEISDISNNALSGLSREALTSLVGEMLKHIISEEVTLLPGSINDSIDLDLIAFSDIPKPAQVELDTEAARDIAKINKREIILFKSGIAELKEALVRNGSGPGVDFDSLPEGTKQYHETISEIIDTLELTITKLEANPVYTTMLDSNLEDKHIYKMRWSSHNASHDALISQRDVVVQNYHLHRQENDSATQEVEKELEAEYKLPEDERSQTKIDDLTETWKHLKIDANWTTDVEKQSEEDSEQPDDTH